MDRIEAKIWEVKSWLMKKYGVDEAHRMTGPLEWYILTGRASGAFLKAFKEAKAYIIGRQLEKGGAYDDTIARIKAKLNAE